MADKNLKQGFKSVIDIRDVVALSGIASIAYGLYLVWLPAAFIVPGFMAFGLAVFSAKGKSE